MNISLFTWHSLLYEVLITFYTFPESCSISFVRFVSFLVFNFEAFLSGNISIFILASKCEREINLFS